jgi:hypothetical protein
MFEHRTDPLLSLPAFRRRLARHGVYALGILAVSLLGGTLGFWSFAGQAPIDALLNAAMLLGGMGPVGEIRATAGKLFATFFALYAGLAFLGMATVLFTPIIHRILHTFHLEEQYRQTGSARTERPPSNKAVKP